MALYSVGTDSFYLSEERQIHKIMQQLFFVRNNKKNLLSDWNLKFVNKEIKKHKDKLIEIFDSQERGKIQRQLNTEDLIAKNVISLFESSLTRSMGIKQGELTEDLIMVEFYFYQVLEDLIYQGFYHNGEKYVYFSSSAGNLRQHKGLFIKESKYKEIMPKLMGGLSIEEINEKGSLVTNKFLAYLALCNSATDVWEGFDIRKAIVVDDFTTTVRGLCDCIDSTDYSITKKIVDVEIPVTDGAGMMAHGTTCVVRAPWIKGLMVQFDFIQFLKEKCTPEQYVVTDIWGTEHNIIEEDIQYIFTKSQLKLSKFYTNWQDYQDKFIKYGCEMCICNVEKQHVPKARLNYQMLQTLSDMTDGEIQSLVKDTNKDIELIGNDFQTTLRLLGADSGASNKNNFQEAVGFYPELFRDAYSKEVLKQTKKSLVKQGKAGRLKINGYYRFVSPDWYGVCENLFMGVKEPKGLLADGEVSINQFRDGDELDCLRSPHLYFEHVLRKNVINEDTKKWFDTKCIYTSSYDFISRILCFDVDGDILLVVKNKTLNNIVRRNQDKITPLYFEMKKADPQELNPENIYNGIVSSFKYGKIGIYSNSISKIWNKEELTQEDLDVIKLLVAESNWSIDAAKTLYMPDRPDKARQDIAQRTKHKLPAFFEYAKDKSKAQCEEPNNSTMNRISSAITDKPIRFSKSLSKFEYKRLLSDMDFEPNTDSYKVLERYDYWNKRQKLVFNSEENKNANDDNYAFLKIRSNIIDETGLDIDFIVNSLVMFLYKDRPQSTKKLLWSCFGDVIIENLKKNVIDIGKICQVCGKRFVPDEYVGNRQITCSEECNKQLNVIRQRERDLDKS